MVRRELIRRIADVMRENNIRKPISLPKQVLHVSDDEGHSKDFVVKQEDKEYLYTIKDIEAVLDACRFVIHEAMKKGEKITIHGFGTLSMNYRQPGVVTSFVDGSKIKVEGHYLPKFTVGNDLKRCGQVYEQYLKDRAARAIDPIPDEEEE